MAEDSAGRLLGALALVAATISEPRRGEGVGGAGAQAPLRGDRAQDGGGTAPLALVPGLRQSRLRWGLSPPAGQRSIASQRPGWPKGIRGNQAAGPSLHKWLKLCFFSHLPGRDHSCCREAWCEDHIQHSVRSKRSTTDSRGH